jgi:hypothetical protein
VALRLLLSVGGVNCERYCNQNDEQQFRYFHRVSFCARRQLVWPSYEAAIEKLTKQSTMR